MVGRREGGREGWWVIVCSWEGHAVFTFLITLVEGGPGMGENYGNSK